MKVGQWGVQQRHCTAQRICASVAAIGQQAADQFEKTADAGWHLLKAI